MAIRESHGAQGEPARESDSPDALVAKAIAGDRDALELLWRGHRRWAAAILVAYRPSTEDLEDLLQEVALTVLRKIGDLRDVSSFRPWLRTIAMNTGRAAGRRVALQRRRTSNSADEIDEVAVFDRHGSVSDDADLVLKSIAELPPEYREPLILRCVHGQGQREIAHTLGLPETTIETRLARARKRLRETLARRGVAPGAEGVV